MIRNVPFQELERQKNLLKQQSSGQTPPAPSNSGSNQLQPASGPRSAEMHLLSANQRAALDMSNKTSFGFFIAQGNKRLSLKGILIFSPFQTKPWKG
jgi:hypothetical protein